MREGGVLYMEGCERVECVREECCICASKVLSGGESRLGVRGCFEGSEW